MIHILTVHWKEAKWIDIQLKYLHKFIADPFKTYAFLNHLPNSYTDRFDYASTEPIQAHGIKLNLLAEIACLSAESDDDILIFIDSDAFPINDLSPYLTDKLSQYPFIAIQRLENNGDYQPHPCFAATTVGLWKTLKGDWKHGYQWPDADGTMVTDVGGNMLQILEQHQINWYPLLRTNTQILHPLFFSVYDNMIYHHGAGSREGLSRVVGAQRGLKQREQMLFSRAIDSLPFTRVRNWFKPIHPVHMLINEINQESKQIKAEMFQKITADDEFYKALIT